jgi:hypothetical protein
MCSKSGHFHQRPEVHKTRNSKPHRGTVTATDYEFQRAVLCCLAAGWSQSPCTLMQDPAWAAPPMCQCACASRLMQSPACIKHLCMRLLNVRHHLASASDHNPEGVPASTVCRCGGKPADAGNKRAWSQSMADRVLGMCSVPKPVLQPYMLGCAGQLCSNNPVGCGQNLSHKQVSTA